MAENKNNGLPDISGIFHIDDSKIPSKVIEKSVEKKGTGGNQQSILLRSQSPKEEKKAYEEMSPEAYRRKKSRKKQAQKKLFRQRLILFGIVLILLVAAVLGIRGLILNRNKPTVTTVTVTTDNLTAHFDTQAVIITEEAENAAPRTYAVFLDNDIDLHPLQKGQRAQITLDEDTVVSGTLTEIRREESGSELISRLMPLMPEQSFSTAVNYVVTVILEDTDNAVEGSTVSMVITTAVAENAKVVPTVTVRYDSDGTPYLFGYKSFGKKLVKIPVTLGLEADGMVVLTGGIADGTSVVYTASVDFSELKDGLKVKAVPFSEEDAVG